MTKTKTVHACADCGTAHPKWSGQCTGCGAWNTLVEEVLGDIVGAGAASGPVAMSTLGLLEDIDALLAAPQPTGIAELDRVLGGGLVAGSVTLLGGEPGIGKSTLLLQLLAWWPGITLYVSAEESAQQVRLRAERLGAVRPDLWLANETTLGGVIAAIDRTAPSLVVVDSIQTIADPQLSLGRGVRRPGARVRPGPGRRRQAARASRSCWSATSPRTARSPGPACSSTSSTPCCRSRASATTPCACCGRSSTASVRPTSWGCSR